MDTIHDNQSTRIYEIAETAGFADIYTQDYSGYFKDIKD